MSMIKMAGVAAASVALSLLAGPGIAVAACATCKQPTKVVAGKTTHSSSTVRTRRTVVQYKNVRRAKYVDVVTREINVRRVIPVTNVRVVTRVHDHTIYPCPKPTCSK